MAMPFDLEAFLPYRLNRAAEIVGQAFAREYKALHGLTRPEWRTLAALGSLGRLTATEIGAHSRMHKTKVSRAVAALEKRRWLRRADAAEDGRIAHIELTASGERAYRDVVALADAYEQKLAKVIGRVGLGQLEDGLSALEAVMLRESASE